MFQSLYLICVFPRSNNTAREEYPRIKVPVMVVYGEQDWAPQQERARTRSLIPGVVTETVENGSHFLSLDCSRELQELIISFAGK